MDDDQLLQEARAAAKSGNRAAAREILERAVVEYPDSAPAWYLLSQVVDDEEQAIRCLEKVLEIEPYSKQARQRLQRWRNAANQPESIEDLSQTFAPRPLALETAEESAASSTAVAVGAILLLAVILALAFRVGLFSIGEGELPTEQLTYQVHLPGDYSPARRWPVFVGVHGFGGSMQDCWDMWHAYIDQAGFILVCPGLADEGGGWYQDEGERALRSLLNEVRREYNVEPQVFLAGFSAGGQFVQGFAFHHPEQVYAVSVLSAGNYYEPTVEASHLPFQVIIGERDNPQALQNAAAFRDFLEQYGYEYEFHILPGAGHTLTSTGVELTIEFFRRVSGSEDN